MKNFFASCPRGLEETLYEEARRYNFDHVEVTRGGIALKGSSLKALTFMFETRVASRVYKEIGSFEFNGDKDLYQGASEIPWTKILNPLDTIKVGTIISREVQKHFRNSHYLSLLLKDAIVDQFKDKSGRRPSIDLDSPTYPFVLRIEPHPKAGTSDKAKRYKGIVSLDMMGSPLNKRGYRKPGHEAPIKENLAAGLIKNISWDKSTPLYDPFCGSGTFLIEAALLKHGICPQIILLKKHQEMEGKFLFETQKWYQKEENLHAPMKNLFNSLISHFENAKRNMGVGEFHANDRDSRSIELLLYSWTALELPRKSLRMESKNALKWKPNEDFPKGVILTNPPYGVRLEEKDPKLMELYHEFGESLKNNWKGFKAFVVIQDPEFRKVISLRTHSRFSFFNGPLECRLAGYELH